MGALLKPYSHSVEQSLVGWGVSYGTVFFMHGQSF